MNSFRLRFDWDSGKAKANLAKHGVDFVVASSSLLDPLATTVFDDEHSEKEERWVTIGVARNGMHFVLVHTWQPTGQNSATARIISARRAVRAEILEYQENLE